MLENQRRVACDQLRSSGANHETLRPYSGWRHAELIAIQEGSDRWEDRSSLIRMATSMSESDLQLVRLEFPRTEIRLYGDTAILYYTYVMEQRLRDKAVVDTGRGTEIFVRRGTRWVDAGWHLDNGAFQIREGGWVRLGEPVPAPSATGVAPTRNPAEVLFANPSTVSSRTSNRAPAHA